MTCVVNVLWEKYDLTIESSGQKGKLKLKLEIVFTRAVPTFGVRSIDRIPEYECKEYKLEILCFYGDSH